MASLLERIRHFQPSDSLKRTLVLSSIAVLLLAVLAIGYQRLYAPRVEELMMQKATIERLNADIRRLQSAPNDLRVAEALAERVQKQMRDLAEILPDRIWHNDVLAHISLSAFVNDVSLTQVEIKPDPATSPIPSTPEGSDDKDDESEDEEPAPVAPGIEFARQMDASRLIVNINAQGRYPDLVNFLYDLETYGAIHEFDNIRILASDRMDDVRLSFDFVLYVSRGGILP